MLIAAVAGAGRCFGWQPLAKVSMMIMQLPRHSRLLLRIFPVRSGLTAGGSRIRTIGPRVMYAFGIGSGRFTRASGQVGVNACHGNDDERALRAKTRQASCRCDRTPPPYGSFGSEFPQCG
jgi:hypothetical protein